MKKSYLKISTVALAVWLPLSMWVSAAAALFGGPGVIAARCMTLGRDHLARSRPTNASGSSTMNLLRHRVDLFRHIGLREAPPHALILGVLHRNMDTIMLP